MKNSFIRVSILSLIFLFAAESVTMCIYFGFNPLIGWLGWAILIFFSIMPSFVKRPSKRLKILSDGADLLCSFLVSLCGVIIFGIYFSSTGYGWFTDTFWKNILTVVLAENIIFWSGIIRVYCTSAMIGLKWRVIGIIVGMIPIANIFALYNIIINARAEVNIEEYHAKLDRERAGKNICKTKYPILLVHGVFFRDIEKLNYWGRIPSELQKNGATVYYGNQQSALSVAESAAEITEVIKKIVSETGCGKVNIIAHSKGGLDSRYAISCLGMAEYTASLTTINTPHRGCVFAEWLLNHTSDGFRNGIADKYNRIFKKLGDTKPDFLKAVNDLCATQCSKMNEYVKNADGVYYQSVGSKMNKAMTNIFPLCFSYSLAKLFDGEKNDGLVTIDSSKWGERFIYLESKTVDGISHADVIDLTRHDKTDFDVREVYVNIVRELKEMGF